jgi:DNA-binding MarR family transcriptional regulator
MLDPVSTRAAREAWASMYDLFVEGEAHDRVHRICAELELSPPLLKAFVHLGTVDEHGDLRMSDLAEWWGCDASYVTALADGLQERGLAERRPHPTDRRVKTIVLTPEGRAKRARALELLAEPPSAFAALTASEQRQLRDLLGKLVAADPELKARSIPA